MGPMTITENQRFSGVFRGYKIGPPKNKRKLRFSGVFRGYKMGTMANFRPIILLYTAWKYQKTSEYPVLSGGIKKKHRFELS